MSDVPVGTLKAAVRELIPNHDPEELKFGAFKLLIEQHLNLGEGSLACRDEELKQLVRDHLGEGQIDAVPEPDMSENEGNSSEESADEVSNARVRGWCGQFVWACPRTYFSTPEARKAQKQLKPEDLSKKEFADLFKKVLKKFSLLACLVAFHIFGEPHKRFNPKTNKRELHYHLIFKFRSNFAHAKLAKD